jgi:signal transduction histidine kinase
LTAITSPGPTELPVNLDDLRATFLFEAFSDDQLRWLAERAEEVSVPANHRVVTEGKEADGLFVLLEGEIQVLRHIAGEEMVMATGTAPGTLAGWLPVFDGLSQVTARTVRPSRVLRIPKPVVNELLTGGFPVATHLMAGITYGIQNFEATARQQEKLAALGKLSAGLAHELNNPAAAATRAAHRLRGVLAERDACALALGGSLTPAQAAFLSDLVRGISARSPKAVGLGPLQRTDREDEIAAWLEGHGVADPYDLAASLVDAGLDEQELAAIAARVEGKVPPALAWIGAAVTADTLTAEIEQSVGRISELVHAIKDYSYMDQAPEQEVDVHRGLDNTLQILGHELRGIDVQRRYAPDLPRVYGAGGEINQVWTNLLDNAISAARQAPAGDPTITIRTAREGKGVLVEIGDNGPGIPADIQGRIFDPFFTTKPPGEGTGIGLDISQRLVTVRHGGTLDFTSAPGDTRFRVWLPLVSAAGRHRAPGDQPPPEGDHPSL